MLAIIALFSPALILLGVRSKMLGFTTNYKKNIILYVFSVITLNWVMDLILFYGFQNAGNIILKLNKYRDFACKYILLAGVIAVIIPSIEYIVKRYFNLDKRKKISEDKNKDKRINVVIKKPSLSVLILYGLFLILMIVTISNKENYHVDETYSYGLANHQGGIAISIEDGKRYSEPAEPFLKYLTVDIEHRFDYQNVWENQSKDVHPPLYYALLHTVCSLFPGTISKWYAGSINILFALLTLLVLRKLILQLTNKNEKIRDIISILFVLSSGILSAISFFRMYILAMFLVTLLIYLLVKEIGIWEFSLSFYVKLGTVALLGALTHYYCIVFTIFMCAVFCMILLLNKRVLPVVGVIITGILSGASAYRIFPYMLYHMFGGYRGTESANNLNQSADEFWERIKNFFNIIDAEIFGNILEYIGVVLLFILILFYVFEKQYHYYSSIKQYIFNSCEYTTKIMLMRYCLIFIPIGMYFFIVSKMAAFVTDRYMFPIYAGAMGGVFCLVIGCLQMFFKDKILLIVTALFMAIIVINEWEDVHWSYLCKDSANLIEMSENKQNVDCLYVYDENWKTQPSFLEVRNYNSVTFVNSSNLEMLSSLEIINNKEMMLLITADSEKILEEILKNCSQFSGYSEIGTYAFTTTYYLSSE